MFQNIEKDFIENQNTYEDVELNKKKRFIDVVKKCINKQTMLLYIVAFLLSFVSFGINEELAPFGLSIVIAILSNCIPIGIVSTLVVIGTSIKFGASATLNLLLTLLLIFISILIKYPKYDNTNNEKRKLGLRLFISSLLVQIVPMLFKEMMLYDLLFCIIYSISAYIFYKIFTNSISAIVNVTEKRVYSIEEVLGTSLMLAISVCAIGNLNIYGYSLKNILCILIVLIMGWKNGVLVGATAGVTIGSVVGIIGNRRTYNDCYICHFRNDSRNF